MISYQCPTCGRILRVPRAAEAPFRPFCSKRCQYTDLSKWLDESYRISEPLDEATEAPETPESGDPSDGS
jgi:endogenous inhibitor of DNA gyrase (YacG/DUF329 family)